VRNACLVAAAACLAVSVHAQLEPDRLAGLKARSIGPAGMSGRITALDAVASDPDVVYAGAATGGLWKSGNAGLTWEPLFDEQPTHAIGAVAIAPSNPDVVWVGTGEGNVRNSVSIGNGVYRSLDGGRTWAHLGLEKTERVSRIAVHPADPDSAWVCATGPEWGEAAERGVFRTADGGRTWQRALFVDEKTGCGDLALDPSNPKKLFASMWEFRRWPHFFRSGGPGSGLYVTHDGGATWRRLQQEEGLPKGDLGRIGLAIAPSDPQVVYAMVEAEKSALIRSGDGGRSWKTVNDSPNVNPRPFYFCDLRVDPVWPSRVYSLDYVVRVSEDWGKTFETLPGAPGNQIHPDHHAMWIDPRNPTHIYAGNDGGVAVSRDRGRTFRFVGNLPLAQYYHVAVDDDRPYHIYGGLQDNGSWRGPSSVWRSGGIRSHEWTEVGGGDGFDTLPQPGSSSRGYSLSQGGYLMRWDLATGEERLVRPAEPEGTKLRFNWNAAIATDPAEPETVFLGSQFVHRSRDRGATWQTISPDLTTNNPEWQKQETSGGLTRDVTAAENHTTLVAIALSPVDRSVIWAGSDDGRLHVTRDGGKTWTSVEKSVAGVPAGTWIPHVEPSRFDPGTAFVVFDNHRRSDFKPYVLRTDDFGKTWSSLASPELRGYCLAIRQDLVKKDLLFLGTELGLYASFDGGRRWTHLKRTLPTASVMDLAIHPREHDLVIGTHGRALFVLDDIRPLRELTEAALAEPLRLFPVASAAQHWRAAEAGGFGFGAGEYRGENRPYGAILTYSLNLPGLPLADRERERDRRERERREARAKADASDDKTKEPAKTDEEPSVEIRVADASGAAVRTFKAPARLGVNRAVWDLRRDAFRKPPRKEAEYGDEEEGAGAGPEVPPGAYTVTIELRGHKASARVEILPDPRSGNSADDWRRREEAIRKMGGIQDSVVDAIWKVRRTRDDVALVQRRVQERAEAAGERDPRKRDELPLVKAGEKLKERLTAIEKELWQPPETRGLVADVDVLSEVQKAFGSLLSSWDPPGPNDLAHVARAEACLAAARPRMEKILTEDVQPFRREATQAGIALLEP
jgi:photosystem II stability/assembly factor-like uncharacterized protein